jgi:hypothetical protein
MEMSKSLASPIVFAAAAILFAVASFANTSGAVSTSLVINSDKTMAPIEMKSSGTLPPDPWTPPPAMIAQK